MIRNEKWESLRQQMKAQGLEESELVEKFIRSSGKGGQNVNKVSTCVYLKDEKTGLEVKCQKTRSQQDNRYFARLLLLKKIEAQREGRRSAEQQRIQKIKRQKRKRSKRAKEKMLDQKSRHSERKQNRKKPRFDD